MGASKSFYCYFPKQEPKRALKAFVQAFMPEISASRKAKCLFFLQIFFPSLNFFLRDFLAAGLIS